jgi:hypothetical protein
MQLGGRQRSLFLCCYLGKTNGRKQSETRDPIYDRPSLDADAATGKEENKGKSHSYLFPSSCYNT